MSGKNIHRFAAVSLALLLLAGCSSSSLPRPGSSAKPFEELKTAVISAARWSKQAASAPLAQPILQRDASGAVLTYKDGAIGFAHWSLENRLVTLYWGWNDGHTDLAVALDKQPALHLLHDQKEHLVPGPAAPDGSLQTVLIPTDPTHQAVLVTDQSQAHAWMIGEGDPVVSLHWLDAHTLIANLGDGVTRWDESGNKASVKTQEGEVLADLPDGRYLIRKPKEVGVLDARTMAYTPLFPVAEYPLFAQTAADGKHVAIQFVAPKEKSTGGFWVGRANAAIAPPDPDTVAIYDTATHEAKVYPNLPNRLLLWHPDGTRLVTYGKAPNNGDGKIHSVTNILQIASGERQSFPDWGAPWGWQGDDLVMNSVSELKLAKPGAAYDTWQPVPGTSEKGTMRDRVFLMTQADTLHAWITTPAGVKHFQRAWSEGAPWQHNQDLASDIYLSPDDQWLLVPTDKGRLYLWRLQNQ